PCRRRRCGGLRRGYRSCWATASTARCSAAPTAATRASFWTSEDRASFRPGWVTPAARLRTGADAVLKLWAEPCCAAPCYARLRRWPIHERPALGRSGPRELHVDDRRLAGAQPLQPAALCRQHLGGVFHPLAVGADGLREQVVARRRRQVDA